MGGLVCSERGLISNSCLPYANARPYFSVRANCVDGRASVDLCAVVVGHACMIVER